MSTISPPDAGNLVLSLLRGVYSDHVKRGPDGRVRREALTQYDGLSYLAGYMAEEVVISRLHLYAADHGVTFRVISMDHPAQMIPADATEADYTVYLIGLDGAKVYGAATDIQLRFRTSTVPFCDRPQYGTRIAIAKGESPAFSQIIAAGLLKPTTGQILVATKGHGVYLHGAYEVGQVDVGTNKRWDPEGLVYCDAALLCLRERFASPLLASYQMATVSPATGVVSLFEVTVGNALASCNWTHDGGLQLITEYLLVTEGGGIVADMLGLDIGSQLTSYFGTTQTMFYVAAGGDGPLEYILTAVPDLRPV